MTSHSELFHNRLKISASTNFVIFNGFFILFIEIIAKGIIRFEKLIVFQLVKECLSFYDLRLLKFNVPNGALSSVFPIKIQYAFLFSP
jgi:hypothetical protein